MRGRRGTHNPLHLDEAFAKRAGLSGIILQGLCTMGMASWAVVEAACGGDVSRLKALSGRFSKPVSMGDEVCVGLWEEGDGFWRVEVTNQRGEGVITRCTAQVG